MKKGKKIVLNDSSLNRYGFRVLTSGLTNLEEFRKNPVLLYMHFRDEGTADWCDYKPIGHWEDIEVVDDILSATPVFDECDELSKVVAAKFEAGTFNAASIGMRIIETSEDKDYILPGQRRATVTKWEILEASIVDIPANPNATRLYLLDYGTRRLTSPGIDVPLIKFESMNLKKAWKTVLAFLKITEDKAETTQLSEDHLMSIDAEMQRLQDENATLRSAKEKAEGDLAAKETELTKLTADLTAKNGEIKNLNESLATKDSEITALKEQVENLKKAPVTEESHLVPGGEGLSDESMAQFCQSKEADDFSAMAERLKNEGLI